MNLYFIILDHGSERSYDGLYGQLHDWHAMKIIDNVYCLEIASTNSRQIRDHLRRFMDRDDTIIVTESNNWAVANVEKSPYKRTESREEE